MERVAGGVWVDVAGRLRRDHGFDRRVLVAARRFLRGEFTARRGGRHSGAAVSTISNWGYPVSVADMDGLAADAGEKTLFYRTGGAPSLALGMAHIFSLTGGSKSGGGRGVLGFWYHFAIMFEALFILTIIAAGTRVGRFMLSDLFGHAFPALKRSNWMPGVFATSGVVVLAWGYFLYQGVRDPLGGINSLWPLFGIANQLLAAVALCVGTTIFIKMHRARYMWITAAPLLWLVDSDVYRRLSEDFLGSAALRVSGGSQPYAERH
jgi:carbon starvation protein